MDEEEKDRLNRLLWQIMGWSIRETDHLKRFDDPNDKTFEIVPPENQADKWDYIDLFHGTLESAESYLPDFVDDGGVLFQIQEWLLEQKEIRQVMIRRYAERLVTKESLYFVGMLVVQNSGLPILKASGITQNYALCRAVEELLKWRNKRGEVMEKKCRERRERRLGNDS